MASKNQSPITRATLPIQEVEIACGLCSIAGMLRPAERDSAGLIIRTVGIEELEDGSESDSVLFSHVGYSVLSVSLLDYEESDLVRSSSNAEYETALLAHRLSLVIEWISMQRKLRRLPIGLFGTGYAASAALQIAAEYPLKIAGVVACSVEPTISEDYLKFVFAPTLFLNRAQDADSELKTELCFESLGCVKKEMTLAEGIQSDRVEEIALDWFFAHLPRIIQPVMSAQFVQTTRPPKDSLPEALL